MWVRLALVGMVATLGFELPSGGDPAGWVRSGRHWLEARLAEFGEARTGVEPPKPVAAGRLDSVTADLVFEAVGEATAADFAADLVASRLERVAPVVVATSPDIALPPTTVGTATRVDRLASAVDLTRQAVTAWADLIRSSDDESASSY